MSRSPQLPWLLMLALGSVGASEPLPRLAPLDKATERGQSLHAMLRYAQQHAPLLEIAQAKQQQAAAARVAATKALTENPQLELTAGPKLAGSGHGSEIEISLSQSIEIAGQRDVRFDVARRSADVARLGVANASWQVHRMVHEAFHQVLLARERAAAAARMLKFAQRLSEVTNKRLEAGEISQMQARLASGELARTKQQHIAADGAATQARMELAGISGWPSDRPLKVAGSLDPPRHTPPLSDLLALAARHNPRLNLHRARVAAAQAGLAAANRSKWPNPSLGLKYAREREPGESNPLHAGLFTVGIDLPFWNRNQVERARASANLAVARAELAFEQANVNTEIRAARLKVELAAERIRTFGSEVVPAFGQNLSLLERAFELGEIDLLQVMVARGRFLEIERDALAAYDAYFASSSQLETHLGAEVWPDEHHGDCDHEESTQ